MYLTCILYHLYKSYYICIYNSTYTRITYTTIVPKDFTLLSINWLE